MELTLFLSFWLCFLNLNYQPHPNYSLICWMMNSSGAKTSIASDLLAEYRKQSIQLGPVSGSLHWDTFFWCSFFFWGGALVWHCLKDILAGFLSWLWSDPFFITCTRLGEDLLDLSGVRETVGLLDIMEWSNRRWAKLQHRHFSLCRWKSYLDPPDLKWGLPILSDSMKSSPKFFSKLERIFKH